MSVRGGLEHLDELEDEARQLNEWVPGIPVHSYREAVRQGRCSRRLFELLEDGSESHIDWNMGGYYCEPCYVQWKQAGGKDCWMCGQPGEPG